MAIARAHGLYFQTGATHLVMTGERHARVPIQAIVSSGLFKQVSSVTVYKGTGSPALLLFRGLPSWTASVFTLMSPINYYGEFMQFTNASDVPLKLNLLGDLGAFDDVTTSMMLVKTQLSSETKLSLRSLIVPAWNDTIGDLLPSRVQQVGDPNVRWDPFPTGKEHLDPNRVYVRIKQRLNVSLPAWSDYKAWIKYWFRVRSLGTGSIDAVVPRAEHWVEPGVFAGDIGDQLEPAVLAGVPLLTLGLNNILGPFSGVTSVYILPGNQTHSIQPGSWDVHWSDTTTDATLVLQT